MALTRRNKIAIKIVTRIKTNIWMKKKTGAHWITFPVRGGRRHFKLYRCIEWIIIALFLRSEMTISDIFFMATILFSNTQKVLIVTHFSFAYDNSITSALLTHNNILSKNRLVFCCCCYLSFFLSMLGVFVKPI